MKDGPETQSVNYIGLIPILINEIKNMKNKIINLETNEIKNLKNRISDLEEIIKHST